MTAESFNKIKIVLKEAMEIIRMYDWLIDADVLDFYVNNHWDSLPKAWQISFQSIHPEDLSYIIGSGKCTAVLPLSLLSLKVLLRNLNISRENVYKTNVASECIIQYPQHKNLFNKGVNAKKRHEIENMSEICYNTARRCITKYVVDVGAGLGHLARKISYGYGLKVCCLEMQSELNVKARKIDCQFEKAYAKHIDHQYFQRPIHINLQVTNDMDFCEFVNSVKNAFGIDKADKSFTFGLIGLHPCGDLAAILLKLFLKCKEAIFLNIIGCCYMKLTTGPKLKFCGYPLSNYLSKMENSNLSYESREIACHAIEMYASRLEDGNYEDLKVHAYRAALEQIIMKSWPHLKHSGLKSIKVNPSLTFTEYCQRATSNLSIDISEELTKSEPINQRLDCWKNVVIFYTLRLFFAPLIETVLLYDRLLYLWENGCDTRIDAIFNPKLSPRNHITTAIKTSSL